MIDDLIKELRSYPAHYVAAHRAADALAGGEKHRSSLLYYTSRLEDDLVKLEAAAESLREHISKQQLDIIALGQEVGRLREALRPFDCLKGNWTHQPDDLPLTVAFNSDVRFSLTLGDFRRARAALGEEKK